jgi:hypothetical protein
MAGVGAPPKDPSRRARRNADPIPTTKLVFEPGDQPDLPDLAPGDEPWPERTVAWWRMWGESPQAKARMFSASDWSELMDTAVLHARFWAGDVKVAPELRLRVAKFGATMEDRARLRIQFAAADEADAKRPAAPVSDRYADLRVVSPTG